ncbi:MAG: hypothetical protein HQK52_02960 [Oligoflexia bacterium]|nr:hypothetical protein [Oligoflexia bacterium]
MEKNKIYWQDLSLLAPSHDSAKMKNFKLAEQSFVVDLFSQGQWFFQVPAMNKALYDLGCNLVQDGAWKDKKAEGELVVTEGIECKQEKEQEKEQGRIVDEDLQQEWVRYLSEVKHCKLCPRSIFYRGHSPQSDSEENEGVALMRRVLAYDKGSVRENTQVLFVCDYPEEGVDKSAPLGEKGILLHKIAKAMGLSENDYKFSFLLKCRPVDEMDGDRVGRMITECLKNFHREICLIRPKVIVSFGALTMTAILETQEKISTIHGHLFKKRFSFGEKGRFCHECMMVPLFNLDYIQINPRMKKMVWDDLQKVISYIRAC